jgi:hypothetical protein
MMALKIRGIRCKRSSNGDGSAFYEDISGVLSLNMPIAQRALYQKWTFGGQHF